jgi:hypothetical protein
MGSSLTASYRLVYFQPDPEDGERVCVALLVSVNRHFEMLYDQSFPKLKCLAPHIDPKLIRIYLDDMEVHLNRGSSDIDFLLRKHAPHLVTSQVRKLAWPLSNTDRIHLVERFLSREKGSGWAEQRKAENDFKADLRQLVQGLAGGAFEELKEGAKPDWVLGRKIPQIKPVALAVRKRSAVLLIDGVNLRELNPTAAVKQVSKVAHTFWQYGRQIDQMDFSGIQSIRRIGVVLNGVKQTSPAWRDAHDYALQEFDMKGDLAVDAARPEHLKALEQEISKA